MRILASSLRFLLLVFAFSVAVGYLSRGIYPAADINSLTPAELASVSTAAAAVAGALATVAATMLGFLIAALAILASVANMRLLRNMQRTGHYQVLLLRLLICALTFAVLLALSVTALFVPVNWPGIWACIFGAMSAAAVTFLDSMRRFAGVLFALKPTGSVLE